MFQQTFEQLLSVDIMAQSQLGEPRSSSGTDGTGAGAHRNACGAFSAQDGRSLPGPWGQFPLL